MMKINLTILQGSSLINIIHDTITAVINERGWVDEKQNEDIVKVIV